MNFLNNIFPNGNLLIMAMFFVAIMFGSGMGLTLQRTKMKSGVTILMLAATVVSFVGYQATIILTEAGQPLIVTEAPMSSEDPRGQELVYVYGKDEPTTRAEHERMLAYSAANSPGDAE